MNALANRQKQILDFANSQEYAQLRAYYAQPSIFSALGASRHENTHSSFLAWLLTPAAPSNSHRLGDLPLRKFLETIALVCSGLPQAAGKLSAEMTNAFVSGDYTLSQVVVEREKHIGVGRLDIYVEGIITFDGKEHPLRIAIENKVKSSEHDSQTVSYQDVLNRAVSRPGIYLSIYLTPLNNRDYERLGAPECECKEFIQLNYQYLADYVIAPCSALAPDEPIKRYLHEYLFTLGLPETRQNKGDIIMAISKEERNLLQRFWETHKELLIAALLAISDSDTLDDADRAITQEVSQILASTKDTRKYVWVQSDVSSAPLAKSRLVLEVVAHYAQTHEPITLAELKTAFPDETQGGFGVVASIDMVEEKNEVRYYMREPLALADGTAVVCNQWHVTNIPNFLKTAETLGYKISSTE